MSDVFDVAKRSQVMSRIKGKGNKKTEIALILLMRANKITGWRRNSSLFGKPDFIFRSNKLAVFVDGCFWHGCPQHSNLPVNNRAFWVAKLAKNVARDKVVGRTLKAAGWSVFRVWEHDLTRKNAPKIVRRLKKATSKKMLPRPVRNIDR